MNGPSGPADWKAFFLNLLRQPAPLRPPSTSGLESFIVVSVPQQRMQWWYRNGWYRSYRISTGRNPPSCQNDSLGTPCGLHQLADKIGDGLPLGAILQGRRFTGRCYQDLTPAENQPNFITTRIIRLRGLEDGLNCGPGHDTYERFIYIHGTNHEERLGQPDTHGCIALANLDMLDFYQRVPDGTPLWIDWHYCFPTDNSPS